MAKSAQWPILVGLLIIAFIAGVLFIETNPNESDANPLTGMGGDFTLESASGSVALKDFRGKNVIIYFGYTSCPDICPTSLGALAQALNKLTTDEQTQLQPIFISVDPARDTLEKLAEYAAYFNSSMLGITGELDQLRKIADQYGAYFRKTEMEGSSMNYAVDHSSSLYLIDPQGKLYSIIQHSDSPTAILEKIRQLLAL